MGRPSPSARREVRIQRVAASLSVALALAVNHLLIMWLVTSIRPGLYDFYGLHAVGDVVAPVTMLFQLLCLGWAVWVLAGRSRFPRRRTAQLQIALVAAVVLVAAVANLFALRVVDRHQEERDEMGIMVASAAAADELAGPLTELVDSVANLRLPDGPRSALFAAEVEVIDVPQQGRVTRSGVEARVGIRTSYWEPDGSPPTIYAPSELSLWPVIFGKLRWLDHGRFEIAHAAWTGRRALDTELIFIGRGRNQDGQLVGLRIPARVRWAKDAAGAWRIHRWHTTSATISTRNGPLFASVLDSLVDADTHQRVTTSDHAERVIAHFRDGAPPPHPHFLPWSALQRPRVTVADVDNDGLDDIYVSRRHADNLLLRNRGDGTFEETAAALGLAVGGMSTATLFVDLDNDGDLDALVGRSVLPAMLLRQEEGVWVDRTAELVEGGLPAMVTAWAPGDFDSDGLVDVFAATAAPEEQTAYLVADPDRVADAALDHSLGLAASDQELLGDLIGIDAGRRLFAQVVAGPQPRTRIDARGPADVLLLNTGGGHLKRARLDREMASRPTVGVDATDIDGDGDPDLLLARRGAPASVWLSSRSNETYEVAFTELADALPDTGSLGTGASWADIDGDGYLDAVLTTGATRAAGQASTVAPRATVGHTWTSLGLAGEGPRTHPMTGVGEGGGWAAALEDFDRDGRLDLMSPRGTWTPPEVLWQGVDGSRAWWVDVLRTSHDFYLDLAELTALSEVPRPVAAAQPLFAEARDQLWLGASDPGRFEDVSSLSGVDAAGDGSQAAAVDLDRDGWLDLVVVNANEPVIGAYRSLIGGSGSPAQGHGFIAIRLVGGNRSARSGRSGSPRDGTGAQVRVVTATGRVLLRAYRPGRTLVVGVGADARVAKVEVIWPRDRTTEVLAPPPGSLITVYEHRRASPTGEHARVEEYGLPIALGGAAAPTRGGRLVLADRLEIDAPLALFTTMATECGPCIEALPDLAAARQAFDAADLMLLGVPMSGADDLDALDAFVERHSPVFRVLDPLSGPERRGVQTLVEQRLGRLEHPASILTDRDGTVLYVSPGVPTVSALRRTLAERRQGASQPR